MKVAIAGSFSVYEEMKELALKLEKLGIECILPKHFKGYKTSELIEKIKQDAQNGRIRLNKKDYQKIGEVKNWFLDQIKKADYVIVLNKAIKEKRTIEGYVGISTSTEIGYAFANGIPVILIHYPTDIGLRGLCSAGLLKVMGVNEALKYLKKKSLKSQSEK